MMSRANASSSYPRRMENSDSDPPNRLSSPRGKHTAMRSQQNAWQLIAKQILPVVFTACALLAVIVFVMSEIKVINITPQRHTTEYATNLVKQGRYEEALPVLQTLKQSGKLDKTQTENLNKVRVSVAKIYAHKKRYSDAISLLQQVSQDSKHADKAKTLIRRYKDGKN